MSVPAIPFPQIAPAKMRFKETPDTVHNVYGFIMLSNMWEVFITEMPDEDGIGFAYVCGFEDEFGSFSMDEYDGHIRIYEKGIDTDPDSPKFVAPPPGAEWVEVMRQPGR